MDDLLDLEWKAPSKPSTTTTPVPLHPSSVGSSYSSFRASPQPTASGIISPPPGSRPSSTVNGASKPTSDAFGSILSLKSQKAGSNLSIQERQRQLQEEKRKQAEQHAQLWDTLGSGRGTPEVRGPSPGAPTMQEDEDDILAAFNKDVKVDKSSWYPPPASTGVSGRSTPAVALGGQGVSVSAGMGGFEEDDDPFGLGAAPKQGNGHVVAPATQQMGDEDDDILGDLARPVTERPPQKAPSRAAEEAEAVFEQMQASAVNGETVDEPEDRALAELVEMGFPADTAKIALAENGGDVQGAVGWLLQQAHEESKQKAQRKARGQAQTRRQSPVAGSTSPPRRQRAGQDETPAWTRQEGRTAPGTRRQDSRSPANGEKDPTQVAQELSSKLFKGAGSLWKASQKQMAKTMADFQAERDPGQPRWMQEPSAESSRASSQRRPEERPAPRAPVRPAIDVTDEAAMLDMPRESRPAKPARPAAAERPVESPARGRSPMDPLPSSQPTFMQQQRPLAQDKRPATKLSRQEVEDQTAQAYVSPARRKRPTPKPEPQPEPEVVDLFSSAPPAKPATVPAPARSPLPARTAQATPVSRPSPAPARPKAPPRNIPSVSPAALSTSARHRKSGGEAFKRGDYAAAHDAYTAALVPLPATHPLMIIVLSNRSLTALKTGDAKTAVSDADRALELIGVSQGAGESIDLGAGEGAKDMREFYGKALMRKAEALEHLEKWRDAASVWRQAIGAGVGGAVSLRGRDRCEKAAAPVAAKTPSAAPVRSTGPAPRKPAPAKSLGNNLQRPTLSTPVSAEAVLRLRAANAAADRADDEKFALTDQVDAKLTAWKGGKADNLRALLQSLDGVLWAGAGWKKVGMSDLVVAGRVKIVYMRAIGKVHPDKIPQDATTEQRMVSAAVFSTLNEAWDKFKRDNNL
ncbi:hypothetical protein LTR36_004489 [Oleoguttula mirabilis]|uniref:UBA domain-containing protein n=1 Tax=Oleoguttula mirabilis TaxID=1507867 RepID=A0AAV9JGR0_9PEZI|nr:hypothetical protein LTR36_004489 [Oleoguttula mirabilis]